MGNAMGWEGKARHLDAARGAVAAAAVVAEVIRGAGAARELGAGREGVGVRDGVHAPARAALKPNRGTEAARFRTA